MVFLNLDTNLAPKGRVAAFFRSFSAFASLAGGSIGLLVLLGWAIGSSAFTSFHRTLVAMNPLTALSFVLAGGSLWLLVRPEAAWRHRLSSYGLARVCGLVVAGLGFLRFSELVFGWHVGVDQILFASQLEAAPAGWPNRMAPNTAVAFLFLGSGLFLLDVETRRKNRPAEFLALGAGLLALMALVGYAYGVTEFYGLSVFIPMALNTAAAFFLLSLGLLCARPDRGLMVLATSDGVGGMVARRLLPAAVAVPFLLGWVRWEGEKAGLYHTGFGIALYTTAMVIVLVALVWMSARSLERMDKERRRAERELDRFFTLSLDLLCIAGYDGYFKRLNPAWEKTLGFTEVELLARPYLEFVHPDDRQVTQAEAQKIAAGADTISFENRYRCQDGSYRWLLWKSTPVADRQLVYASARDITARKQDEARLQQLNAELEATNKELEAFTYSVSHDLRAPLRHVDGFSRILVEEFGPKLDPTARRYLERMQKGVRNMAQLVDDLLQLAHIGRQELRRQVTGLNPLVAEVVADLEPETETRRIDWRVAQLPFADCDPALMKQVFANLLSNAVKYTRPRQQAVIEVGTLNQNGQSAVFVRDNGVGFSMKYADKLFGVFQRLHRAEDFEGTGVGLATVQRIVHKHGGRVWAEAELDKGATFYFTLGAEANPEAALHTTSGGVPWEQPTAK